MASTCATLATVILLAILYRQMSRDITLSNLNIKNVGFEPIYLDSAKGAIKVTQGEKVVYLRDIGHGPYDFRLRLSDGQTLRLVYFLTDAGRVADVDVLVSHKTGSKTAHVKCITNRRPTLLHGSEIEFDGDIVLPAKHDSPISLKGV